MILHPGVIAALRYKDADELGIAKLMSEGEIGSPQTYHNVTLFNIRITGTSVAFRPALNEYVYRKPENYTSQEALNVIRQGRVVVNIGQLDRIAKYQLEMEVRRGNIVKWRGHWYPVTGADWGLGPLKTCYGLREAKP